MANDGSVRTYSPKEISITWGEIIFTGFADGDFLAISGEDGFESREGSDGSEDRVNKNKLGRNVDITIMKTSITNDALYAAFETDRLSNNGKKPLFIKDLNGTMQLTSAQAYIKKIPDTTLGDSAGNITWNFRAPQAVFNPGSNL